MIQNVPKIFFTSFNIYNQSKKLIALRLSLQLMQHYEVQPEDGAPTVEPKTRILLIPSKPINLRFLPRPWGGGERGLCHQVSSFLYVWMNQLDTLIHHEKLKATNFLDVVRKRDISLLLYNNVVTCHRIWSQINCLEFVYWCLHSLSCGRRSLVSFPFPQLPGHKKTVFTFCDLCRLITFAYFFICWLRFHTHNHTFCISVRIFVDEMHLSTSTV